MGVLACDRNGCESIMCDYYSDTFGYLCYECMNELRDKACDMKVEQFMDLNKDKPRLDLREVRLKFIEQEFQVRQ